MKRFSRIPIILGIVILVLSIIVFSIPFSKTEVFWLSYAFSMLALIVQWPISIISLKKGDTVKSKVYGWPIMRIGLFYLVMVLLVAILSTVFSCILVQVPIWIPMVCYILLSGLVAIGCVSLDSVRNFVEEQEIQLKPQTDFMKRLYAESVALEKSVSDSQMKKVLSKIADEIRYSDPVSSPDLEAVESRLYEIFHIIREEVMKKDIEKVRTSTEQFHQQLMIRNAMCKVGKR